MIEQLAQPAFFCIEQLAQPAFFVLFLDILVGILVQTWCLYEAHNFDYDMSAIEQLAQPAFFDFDWISWMSYLCKRGDYIRSTFLVTI